MACSSSRPTLSLFERDYTAYSIKLYNGFFFDPRGPRQIALRNVDVLLDAQYERHLELLHYRHTVELDRAVTKTEYQQATVKYQEHLQEADRRMKEHKVAEKAAIDRMTGEAFDRWIGEYLKNADTRALLAYCHGQQAQAHKQLVTQKTDLMAIETDGRPYQNNPISIETGDMCKGRHTPFEVAIPPIYMMIFGEMQAAS